MATIFDRERFSGRDDPKEMLRGIVAISKDDNHRVLLTDEVAWLETKLAECGRIADLLLRKRSRARTKKASS